MAVAPGIWGMLIAQLIFGIPRGIPWIASQTYITGIGTPAEQPRITGRFSFFVNGGLFVAPLMLGVVANTIGYRNSFFFLTLVALFFTVLGLCLPEIGQGQSRTAARSGSLIGFGDARQALRSRPIQIMILFSLSRVWVWTVWPAFFPVYLATLGYSAIMIGLIIGSRGALATLAPLFTSRVLKLASVEWSCALTVLLMALGVTLSPLVVGYPWVFLPAMLIGAADGINLPLLLTITAAAAPAGRRGIATAMRVGANQGASIVAPIAGGALIGALGVPLGFAVSSILAMGLLGAGVWSHIRNTRERAGVSS
jgi:predicted MFS family arabinose efflux permease